MKLKNKVVEWIWVNFKYEHAPTFCFICGIIGHSERLCPRLFLQEGEVKEKLYENWMRVVPRRSTQNFGSKWLRQEPLMLTQSENMDGTSYQVARGSSNRDESIKEKNPEGNDFSSEIVGEISAGEKTEN